MKKVKKLKIELTLSIFLLVAILISGFFIFSPISIRQIAQAVGGDYDKATGDSLTALSDWNQLEDDFLDKESTAGDSMAGPLTLPADPTNNLEAATKQYVDNSINPIKDVSNLTGPNLKIVCGTANNWYELPPPANPDDTFSLDVTIPAGEFSNTPRIFVQLSGTSQVLWALGAVYNAFPTSFSYAVWNGNYFNELGVRTNLSDLTTWNWEISWCAVERL